MTIYQLAALNKSNGGLWFSRDTMKASNQTLKSFRIKNDKARNLVILTDKRDGRISYFNATTGRTEYPVKA